ncbi:MAG: histidine phosphatase family protein [Chitinophagales bacterium]
MTKQLFIIRHGETDNNKQGIVQGRGVNPSLNDIGREQSLLFYQRYCNQPFEIIYTSTLRRSYESVSLFIEKGIPWERHAELDEISWGIFEGQPVTPEFKALYQQLQEDWKAGDFNQKAEGGESPVEVSLRQMKFIQYLLSKPEKEILICMHGRAIRMFLANLLGEDLSAMEKYPHSNLTLYKLIFDGERFSITIYNNRDHLKV